MVKASRAAPWAGLAEAAERGQAGSRRRLTVLAPALRRSVRALRHSVPRWGGWCRPRWSCAPIALALQARRGSGGSGETVRRWLPELGWVWKRAQLRAKDDEPQRGETLARSRYAFAQLRAGVTLFFAAELDLHLLPKVGSQGRPQGEQGEVRTPGTNEKRHLAGALDITTGPMPHWVWYRKTTGLFLDLLQTLERTSPAPSFLRLSVGVDTAKLHQAVAVQQWLAAPPRFELLSLPTSCPQAHPLDRAFGDVHDKCTRNHPRKRIWPLVQEVKRHLQVNGPWRYALSELYSTPEVTAALQALRVAETSPEALSQLAA